MLTKIIDEDTKECLIVNQEEAKEIPDMEELNVECSYDGRLYLKGFAPEEPLALKNEAIRKERQLRFKEEADPLKLDYDEALARDDGTADEKKQLWLDKKDEIRAELPYVVEVKATTKKRKKAST